MKHTLKRLGVRTYKWDAKLGWVEEVTAAKPKRDECMYRTAPTVILFKEEWYEHIAEHPIFITSKKQLRAECEKRGMIAKALD